MCYSCVRGQTRATSVPAVRITSGSNTRVFASFTEAARGPPEPPDKSVSRSSGPAVHLSQYYTEI